MRKGYTQSHKPRASSWREASPREQAGAPLEAKMAALPRKTKLIDAQEEDCYGKERRGNQLPQEIPRRQDRIDALRRAMVKSAGRVRATCQGAQKSW